jgi:hypothetical protein
MDEFSRHPLVIANVIIKLLSGLRLPQLAFAVLRSARGHRLEVATVRRSTSMAGSPRSRRRSRRLPLTMIAKSCRSGSRNSPVGSR